MSSQGYGSRVGSISISKSGTTYTTTIIDSGLSFALGQQVVIPGTSLGGDTTTNDATVTVTSIGSYGQITGVSTSGTAKTQYAVTIPNTHGGTDALLQVYITGTTYATDKTINESFLSNYTNTAPSHSGTDDGRGFVIGDTYTISGAEIGGEDGINDIVFRVTSVGGGVGEILGYEFSDGTGPAISSFGPFVFPFPHAGYPFNLRSIRDGSDWIAYKRQALIFATEKSKAEITQNQWAQYGNDYRVQWQLGRYKTNQGPTGDCGGCLSGSFGGTGPAM